MSKSSSGRQRRSFEPRPARTLLLFEAVITSFHERIRLTAAKKPSPPLLASSVTGSFNNGTDENMYSSLLACLEAKLDSVSQLHQRYKWVLGQRQNVTLKESQLLNGAESAGNHTAERRRTIASTLHALRSEADRMDAELYSLEARLESSQLGYLECSIHGLAGFAALSPFSTFLLTFKHSDQKWRCRIVTGKCNKQFLENDTHKFKIVLDYSLGIKAEEERSFGSGSSTSTSGSSGSGTSGVWRNLVPRSFLPHRLIGTVNFDVLPLISALPQLLTISLNTSGSIKMHVIVKWLPAPTVTDVATGLALELRSTMLGDKSGRLNGAVTFAARSGRRNFNQSPKNGKDSSRTVRQHRSMSLNPRDVGALLSQLAVDDMRGSEGTSAGSIPDPSDASSVSPVPSLSRSWLRTMHSPRSDVDDSSTLSRSQQPPPGAGLDRIRALALHDLNASSDFKVIAENGEQSDFRVNNRSGSPSVPTTHASVDKKLSLPGDNLEKCLNAVGSVLDEIRGRWMEVSEFEEAFVGLQEVLTRNANLAVDSKLTNPAAFGLPTRSSSVRQSIRKRRHHMDLQINVEPSPLETNNRKKNIVLTAWPELDSAVASHMQRCLADLKRLATISFVLPEIGNMARDSILQSLRRHSNALCKVFIPLISADPVNRPSLATEITALLLAAVDSHSLWSALSKSPSGLIAVPTEILHNELTKRISAARTAQGSYGYPTNIIADVVLCKIAYYYGEFVHGVSTQSIAHMSRSLPAVITLVDFATFAGFSPGILSKLEEISDEMKLCLCLQPPGVSRNSLHDDHIYASALQVTRRQPSGMVAHALAHAAAVNGPSKLVLVTALRSASPDWLEQLLNCVGSVLLWMSATENEREESQEFVQIRLSFVSLLQLLTYSASQVSKNLSVQNMVASVLAQLAVHDCENSVRSSARAAVLSMGQLGAAVLAKTDRAANAFQGLAVTGSTPVFMASDDGDESVEEI